MGSEYDRGCAPYARALPRPCSYHSEKGSIPALLIKGYCGTKHVLEQIFSPGVIGGLHICTK